MREANTITSEEEALALINHYGLMTLFPVKGTQFPSLYQAITGTREAKLNNTWTWSDRLAQHKHIHYGKLVRKQVTLASLKMVPNFLCLGRRIVLGETATRILDFLRTHGKTSTTTLRKTLGFQQKEQKSQFVHAIDNLQMALAIAIVQREPAPRFTYTYDLMERWMPKPLLEQAQKTTPETAQEHIITQLLNTGIISNPKQVEQFLKPYLQSITKN